MCKDSAVGGTFLGKAQEFNLASKHLIPLAKNGLIQEVWGSRCGQVHLHGADEYLDEIRGQVGASGR